MRILAHIDLYDPSEVLDDAGSALDLPPFTLAKTVILGLRFFDRAGGGRFLRDLDIRALNATVLQLDLPEDVDGTFSVAAGAHVTAPVQARTTAQTLSSAINALAAVVGAYGACSGVDAGPSVWVLTFAQNTGAVPLEGALMKLSRSCFLRVRPYQDNGIWRHEVRLILSPIAATSNTSRVVPEGPTDPVRIVAGAWIAGSSVNEVQSFRVPRTFRGTYSIRKGLGRTKLLDLVDAAEDIQDALAEAFGGAGNWLVSNPTDDEIHIEFTGDFAGLPQALLTISVETAPPGDWTVRLDLNTGEAFAALRDRSEDDYVLEIDAHVAGPAADPQALGEPWLLLRTPVKVRKDGRWSGLEVVPNIEWQRPPEPSTYVPYSPGQTVTGQQHYIRVIGDAVGHNFLITHNLGTENLASVVVRENAENGTHLLHPTNYQIESGGENQTRLIFATPPGVNAVVVIFTSAGPTTAFVEGLEIEIPQVIGLEDLLDDLGERLNTVETLYALTGVPGDRTQPSGTAFLLALKGAALHHRGESPFGENGLFDPKKLGGVVPRMLRAAHDAAVVDFPVGPLGEASGHTGEVFCNTTAAELLLEGGSGIKSETVPVDEHFASDGFAWYRVQQEVSTNTWHPLAFEVELFRLTINERQLAVNRTLEIQWGLLLATVKATSDAQWILRVEIGIVQRRTTPSPTGQNVSGITWLAAPWLQQVILVSDIPQTHSFGVRIARTVVAAVDTLTLQNMAYGIWTGETDAAPQDANFVVRARLTQFDVEDAVTTDHRGFVVWQLIGPSGSDENGAPAGKPSALIK